MASNRSLGVLTIDLVAKTGGFVAGMDKAAKSAKKSVDSIAKTVNNAATVIGAGIAAASVVVAAWTNNTINAAVEIERLSQLSNTSAENFQRWAVGAYTVGIEQQKLADILKDTQDKVGDFIQTGGGALADFFENIAPKVGVTAEQFRKLSGPDALQLYVSSLEKANISQSDMIFYLEAIASDSSLLLPLLKNNGEALGEWADKAEELGAILGEDTIYAAKEAKKEFQTLGLVYEGLKNRIVEQLLPSLLSLTQQFTDTAQGTAKLDEISRVASTGVKLLAVTGTVVAGVFKSVGTAIGGAAAVLERLLNFDPAAAFNLSQDVFRDFNANLMKTGADAAKIWNGSVNAILMEPPPAPDTSGLSKGFEKESKKIVSDFEKAQNKIQDILDGISEDVATYGLTSSEKTIFGLMALGASDAQIEVARLKLATLDWLDATVAGMEEIERYEQERQERSNDVLRSIQEEIDLMGMTIEQQEIYNNLKWAGVEAESERGKEIAKNTALLQAQRQQVSDQIKVMDAVRDASKGLFVDLVEGSKSFKNAFVDALELIRDRLIQIAADRFIQQLLGQSGTADTGAAGGFLGAFASIFSSAIGGSRATGGPVTAGRLYEVGENGRPELLTSANGKQYLIPGNNSNITPMSGGGASGTPNFQVNINITDSGSSTQSSSGEAEQSAKQLVGMIEGVVSQWWVKQNRPGGSVYRQRVGA